MRCSPYLETKPDARRVAEADIEAAAHYRDRAFAAAADLNPDAARTFSMLADLAQLRAEEAFR